MKRNWFWGLICILGAILIFGNLFGFLSFTFSLWKIIGTLICLSVIIDGIKERSFYSPLFGIAIIFYLFRENFGFPSISICLFLGRIMLVSPQANNQVAKSKSHREISSKPKSFLNK